MTLFREAELRRHQAKQSGMRDQGSSQLDMPRNLDDPARFAQANREVATASTTQPAAYAQSQSTGTGVGGNMQPPSARPTYADAGVANTWPDTQGNIPNSPAGYNPQLTRTDISTPEGVKAEQALLARYVAMIQAAGAAHQRQA